MGLCFRRYNYGGMMSKPLSPVIQIDHNKCVNCHQCIQVCPVKFCNDGTKDYIELNSDLCLGCGTCLDVCQHDARTPIDDFDEFMSAVSRRERIVGIVAPAAASNFPEEYLHVNGWLASIGVEAIFDVSFGAELTVKSYLEHVKQNNPKTVIAQPCPALVTFAEIYHPELLPYLAPADSPMMHTMKMVREYYPQYAEHKMVVISPCLAKRREFDEVGIGDFNVTMKSIETYIEKQGKNWFGFKQREFDNPPAERAVLFSTPGGLMRTAEREVPGITAKTRKIEGTHSVYDYLSELGPIIDSGQAPLLVDCLSCEKGCNGGPGTLNRKKHMEKIEFSVEVRARAHREKYEAKGLFKNSRSSQANLRKYVDKYWKPGLYDRTYVDRSTRNQINIPSKYQLEEIYQRTHKIVPEDFLHCSSCGYRDCEEMAVALFNGLTKPENCRHFQEYVVEREKKAAVNAQESLAKENDVRMVYMQKISEMITDLTIKSSQIKKSCSTSMEQTVIAVTHVNNTSEFMVRLKESTDQISALLGTVKDISERVHILGLNASIEAVKAGDSGLGFAVVADEIKALAKHTQEQVRNINQTLEVINSHAEGTTDLSQKSCVIMENIQDAYSIISSVLNEQSTVIDKIAQESESLQSNAYAAVPIM